MLHVHTLLSLIIAVDFSYEDAIQAYSQIFETRHF